jgi:hypothetical protein
MAVAATVTVRDRRRGSRAHVAITAEEDGEEQHLNPFLDVLSSASSKVQFRCVVCIAYSLVGLMMLLVRTVGMTRPLGSIAVGAGRWRRVRGGLRKPALRKWWTARASCG